MRTLGSNGYNLEAMLRSPGGLRGAARARLDEAALHPVWSDEHRRHMLLATQYEREAFEAERAR